MLRDRSLIIILFVFFFVACTEANVATPEAGGAEEDDGFVFGLILVGPQDDHGWSEAHYKGGEYLLQQIEGSRMLLEANLNPEAKPDTTLEQVVDGMVEDGADMIFVTSDDFSADTAFAATQHPDTAFVHISGDHALEADAPDNISNYYARMFYSKMIAGCAAALATETGHIGYVGPLINSETRRLANAAFLGARYCYETYRGMDPAALQFHVEWIGFWFHIPGVTEDPTQVTEDLIDDGADVIMSGIDTTEPIETVAARAKDGEKVWSVPYDYEGACEVAPEVCLGVPYFNWRPGYLHLAEDYFDGGLEAHFEWEPPYWEDINNLERSPVGFARGAALTEAHAATLDEFTAGLADGSIVLFAGPLNYQTMPFLGVNEVATDEEIWYTPQLLHGMEGVSE